MLLVEKILERLQEAAEETADLLDIALSGYHESYRKMWRSIKHGPRRFDTDWAAWYRERKRFHNLLYRLKADGLIKQRRQKDSRQSLWQISRKGNTRLLEMKRRIGQPLSRAPTRQYPKEPAASLMLVIFDIPEREKAKRDWLRFALRQLGFSLLQRSVWIGEQKLPEEFIRDLRTHDILPYMHIFSVNKRGSINHHTQ